MRFLGFVAAVSLATIVAACGLDEEGLISPGPGDGGDALPMDARAGEAGNPPGPDARGVDARKDAVPGVDAKSGDTGGSGPCPTVPDCSNAACKSQGYVCTPPAPTGWNIAAVDFTTGVACPPGSGTGYTVVSAPTGGSAVCGCSCALGESPSCVVGSIDTEFAYGSATCGGLTILDANDGACAVKGASFADYVEVSSLPTVLGGTCNGTPTTAKPPPGSTPAFVCPLGSGAPSTTGCTGGDVCVAAFSTETQCILQSGSGSCTGAYSVLHAVGASVMDTRACTGACSCGAPTATCGAQSLTFYSNPDCSGGSYDVPLDGACDATGLSPGNGFSSYRYTASPAGTTCGSATSTPTSTGSLSLADAHTLCCLP